MTLQGTVLPQPGTFCRNSLTLSAENAQHEPLGLRARRQCGYQGHLPYQKDVSDLRDLIFNQRKTLLHDIDAADLTLFKERTF
jgi:hypothetical protein